MIHIRIDDERENGGRRFACGLGPELPPGDTYFFEGERQAEWQSDCPGCNPAGPGRDRAGIPIDQLSGRAVPGDPGWENFKRLAASWGYD
jgi:hypothetical protein